MTRLAQLILVGLASALMADAASAACRITGFTSIVPSTADAGTYTPPTAPTARQVNVTITTTTDGGSGQCQGAFSFQRTSLPAQMVDGAGVLPFTVRSTSGNTLLYTGASPAGANRLEFDVTTANPTASLILVFLEQPGATVLAGTGYLDTLTATVFERNGNNLYASYSRPFTVTGAVTGSCTFANPAPLSIAFIAADVPFGRPNSGVVRNTTTSTVTCTIPAKIRLTADALRPSPALPPNPSFDNFINFSATAGPFLGQSVTLNTTSAGSSSATSGFTSSTPSGQAVGISVNLLDSGQPVLAGSYQSILTVTIDPNL